MNRAIEKPMLALLEFIELCVVFTVVFGFVIGGGIMFFRMVYWMVS